MELVLDTSILIDVERGDQEIINKIVKITKGKNIHITSPTLSEVWFGILNLKRKKEMEDRIDSYLLLNTSKNSSKLFSSIKLDLIKKGKLVPDFDILIASIVIDNNMTLVTKDKHFQKIKDLKCVAF